MADMLALRDYQAAAVKAVRTAWSDGIRRPGVVLPTGAGKTVVFSHLIKVMHGLGVRTVILVHRDELIRQAVDKLRKVAPNLIVGILKGSRREIRGRDVVVASVQSLVREQRRAELAAAGFRLVIVDEAHHAVANTYMNVLRDMGCFEEDPLRGAYALGVTATMGRSDRLALGEVWQKVVYTHDILDMIREGHLVRPFGRRVWVDGLDLAGVRRSRGDYQDGALAEAMHAALAPKAVARAYVDHAAGRSGVLFAPTVELAYEMAEALRAEGVQAQGLDGTMALGQRRGLLAAHERGEVKVLCNCAVLTEGWDAPWCSAAVIARPTSSATLYVQMAGRVLRPYPGKGDALILDVAGVTGKHKLRSVVDLAGADRVDELPPELAQYEDDEQILDLLDVFDAPGRPERKAHDGPLASELVDLFAGSRQSWLRTRRGVWFLGTKANWIFLAPGSSPGLYAVARVPVRWNPDRRGEFLNQDLDLETAMAWGEQHAAEETTLTRRGAAWRRGTPTQAQRSEAERCGIVFEGMTKGQLSDAISIHKASERLDHMLVVATVTEKGYHQE